MHGCFACMYVLQVCVQYSCRPEEGTGSPGTGVQDSHHMAARNQIWWLLEEQLVLIVRLWAIFPAPPFVLFWLAGWLVWFGLVGFCLFVCFGKILYLQISQFIPTSITVKRIGSYRDSVCAIKGNRWHCFLCFSQGHLATVPQIVKSSFYLLSLLLSFKFWVSFCSPSWTQICDSAWSSI